MIGVAVLILLCFCARALCRRCCCCCQSRATKLQQAGKRKGTPATKFSKITILDDDDEIDGLELPSTTSSKEDAVVNEFGISFGSESRGGASSRSHKISNQAKGNGTGASSGAKSSSATLHLASNPVLDAEQFEPKWQSMSQTKLWGTNVVRIPTEQEFEDLLLRSSVHCMASGQVEDTQKFYFYAQEVGGRQALYLIEASITKSSKRLACVFKSGPGGRLATFIELISSGLQKGGLVA